MNEAELTNLLRSLKPGTAATQAQFARLLTSWRATNTDDEIASRLLGDYAQADHKAVCENVMAALVVLYSSAPGEAERFPSETVQRLYGETLLAAINRPVDPAVRVNAIINLRGEDYARQGQRLLDALASALRSASSRVRYRAALQLIELDRAQALELLLDALDDPACHVTQESPEGRCSAVWDLLMALDEYGATPKQAERAINEVARFLKKVRPETELGYLDFWKAADTMAANLGHPQLVFQHFAQLVNHPDWRVRESVAHALEHLAITSDQAAKLLITLAQDREPEVAAEARKTYAVVRDSARARRPETTPAQRKEK